MVCSVVSPVRSPGDTATVQQEAFSELLKLVAMSPVYQQQVSLKQLIQLSPIPHRRSVLDAVAQAEQEHAQARARAQALQAAHLQARTQEAQAGALERAAGGQAKMIDALTYAHASQADHVARGLESGIAVQQAGQAQSDATGP